MADKRSQNSVPPQPPPPPSVLKSASPLGETAVDPSAPQLTNGVVQEKPQKASIPPKPKPPSKPFKITRAFSSGSMTFGRIGKARKKSKNSMENENPENEDINIATTPAKNETINELLNESEEKEKNSLWKLPGIETASKMQGKLLKSRAISDSSLLDRELPQLPDQKSRELLENRELPPLPPPEPDAAAQSMSASPLLLPSPGTRESELLGQPSKALSTSASNNEGIIPTYVNVQSPIGNDNLGSKEKTLSPVPGTPPNAEDSSDLNANSFRPLPQSPPLSDYEDELGVAQSPVCSDMPTEKQNGFIETEQANLDTKDKASKGLMGAPDASSHELPIDKTATDRDGVEGSSKSIITPSDLPATQQEELRDYTIGEIVSTYSYALPVCVKILQGYCSDTTEVNISTEDVYNIHSVQHTRKLMVKDEDGMTHRVSLEAPVKMGLVFNPNSDSDESLNGYSFKTIADVTSLPILPKVISATQSVNCGDEKNSVSEGEVFIIKQVQRSVFKGKKGLKVYSFLTNTIKVLFDECPGSFSTKPSLVKMSLPDLLEKVADIYTSCCVIYPTTDNVGHKSDFPGKLAKSLHRV